MLALNVLWELEFVFILHVQISAGNHSLFLLMSGDKCDSYLMFPSKVLSTFHWDNELNYFTFLNAMKICTVVMCGPRSGDRWSGPPTPLENHKLVLCGNKAKQYRIKLIPIPLLRPEHFLLKHIYYIT